MKKWCIALVAVLSVVVFCTKDNPTAVSASSDFKDSIVVDLFSYNVYNITHYKQYYGSASLTAKGQALYKPIESSILKSYDTNNLSTVLIPKYQPNRFEAWLDDSIPMITTDETDTNVLIKAYSFSMNYFLRPDSVGMDLNRCIKPVPMTYVYGYGFVIPDAIWGLGKLKIYYN